MARGRLAEIFGSDSLESDIFSRTMGYNDEELHAGFDALSDDAKAMVRGYMAGFNRRIVEVRGDMDLWPFEYKALGLLLEEWTNSDVPTAVEKFYLIV